MYRTGIITFCGSDIKVEFDVNGDSCKTCFNDYENGQYKQGRVMKTRHPNILKSVITSKKGWGLWVEEWGQGIGDCLFSKDDILKEFEMRKIELPESFLKELDDSIQRRKRHRYPTEEQIRKMNALVGRG